MWYWSFLNRKLVLYSIGEGLQTPKTVHPAPFFNVPIKGWRYSYCCKYVHTNKCYPFVFPLH